MGSVYAGLLAEAGHEVWAIDIWQEHLHIISTIGLRVEGASGDRVVKGIHTASDAGEVGTCDLVIIATKASGVGAAARSIKPMLGERTLILTIQNGLGAGERISEHLSSDNVLLGVAEGFGASMKGPGHAHHNSMKLIRIGEMSGGLTDRVENVAAFWRGAGFDVKAFGDINQLIWEKFICNVAFSAPCTVFGWTLGELMANENAWRVSLGCGREAYAAGIAKGVTLSFDDPDAYVREFGARMPAARPSMLLDHMANRPSEIDAINGMVPVVAAQVGTQAPYNEVVTAIVKAREAAF